MAKPIIDLDDKVVLITGGGGGLGAAHARVLADSGARVVLADLAAGAAESAAARLNEAGSAALGLGLDVTDREQWTAVVEEIGRRYGRIDALVNNAGVYEPVSLLESDERLFDLEMRVNVLGAVNGMQAVFPLMREHGGAVVNIASVAGIRGYSTAALYSASKWAVRGLSRSAAAELGRYGIRVNTICPGAMDTQMITEETRAGGGAVATIPISRPGAPEEASALVAFLISAASSYCTGQDFVIDGGMTA
ncbi:SDR family NAD(P)-dependent oxidoreductase [Sciscionella marina]|uniref:SDR family NAD(P)-dependent oxidoreductase n=1 Tax=Sciscionella marina TaxID=508770 RepID=UPI0003730D84|nr:SDR family oxidoreductase [Sciscionella marina]